MPKSDNRVSQIYDFVFSTPSAKEYMTETRFDNTSSPTGANLNPISKLAELTNQSVSSIPYPVKDNRGHGEEFKSWFLKNGVYKVKTSLGNFSVNMRKETITKK